MSGPSGQFEDVAALIARRRHEGSSEKRLMVAVLVDAISLVIDGEYEATAIDRAAARTEALEWLMTPGPRKPKLYSVESVFDLLGIHLAAFRYSLSHAEISVASIRELRRHFASAATNTVIGRREDHAPMVGVDYGSTESLSG